MADIAMLVAEEYERRLKKETSRKNNTETEQMDLISCRVVLAERMRKVDWANKEVGKYSMEIVRKALEPKSELGLEAINGFFSA